MIGLFDSGVGGLTIFRAIEARLPEYDYIYLGDNARAPYGDHSQQVILNHTTEGVRYLFERGCGLVLLACNTASSEALRQLQHDWLPKNYAGRNILGVIRPLAEAAAEITRNKQIGVMATRSTVASGAYPRELKKQDPAIRVVQQACRLLGPMIEEGLGGKPEARMILKRYVRPLKSETIDTVILGCTHYEIIRQDIERYFGRRVKVLDSGSIVAEKFADYLSRHPEYEKVLTRQGQREFLTTESVAVVAPLVQKFLGRQVELRQISLASD